MTKLNSAASTLFLSIGLSGLLPNAYANQRDELFSLSLEELLSIEITSVSNTAEQLENAAASVYIFERQQFEALGIHNLIDLLRYAPSVEYAYPHSWLQGGMRGFADNWSKVKLLLDGEEINLMYTGEAFIGHQFSLHNIERVEIIPGPASVIYGADAYTGIINLVSRKDKGREITTRGSTAERDFQSKSMSLYYGQVSAATDWTVSLYYQDMDDGDFGDYVVTPEFSEVNQGLRASTMASGDHPYRDKNYAYSLSGSWNITLDLENSLSVRADKLFDRDGGGQESPEISFTRFYTKRDQDKLSVSHEYHARDGRKSSTLNLRYRKDDELNKFNYRSPYDGGVSPLFNFNIEGSLEYAAHWHGRYQMPQSDFEISGGLGWVIRDLKVPDFEEGEFSALTPYLDQDNLHAYLQLSKSVFDDNDKLSLGVRKDDNKIYDSPSVYRLAYIRNLTSAWTLKFLYGESFRAPTLFELEIVDNLKPSLMETQEIASIYKLNKHWLIQAAVYKNIATDFIAIIQTAGNDNEDDLFGGFNDEKSEATGAELKLSYHHSRGHFMAWWNHTQTDSQENIAKNKITLTAHYTINNWLSFGLAHKYTEAIDTEYERELDEQTETLQLTVPTYSSTDINFNMSPPGKPYYAFFKIWNVFDKINHFPNVRGKDPKQFIELGRKFELGFRYSF